MARRKGSKRANGDGTVFPRKDGRWVAAVSFQDRGSGSHRKEVYRTTRKEAQDVLRKLLAERDAGQLVVPSRETVGQFLTRWLTDIAPLTRRPKTLHTYRAMIEHHLIPELGHLRLDALQPEHIDRLQRRAREAGLAPRTIQVLRAVLSVALGVAETRGLVGRNPVKVVEGPRIEPYASVALGTVDAQRLLAAASAERFEVGYHLAVRLGLREGEILGLRWQDIDWEGQQLHVRVQLERAGPPPVWAEPKTKHSRRTLHLPATVVRLLRAHQQRQFLERNAMVPGRWQEYGLVFTRPDGRAISGQACRAAFAKLLARVGMPPMRFHDLRHTSATGMAKSGTTARTSMEVFGHRDMETNQMIYTHVAGADVAAAIDGWSDVLDRAVVAGSVAGKRDEVG